MPRAPTSAAAQNSSGCEPTFFGPACPAHGSGNGRSAEAHSCSKPSDIIQNPMCPIVAYEFSGLRCSRCEEFAMPWQKAPCGVSRGVQSKAGAHHPRLDMTRPSSVRAAAPEIASGPRWNVQSYPRLRTREHGRTIQHVSLAPRQWIRPPRLPSSSRQSLQANRASGSGLHTCHD